MKNQGNMIAKVHNISINEPKDIEIQMSGF